MSLINTCSTAAAALLKNTENRTSSRPTYDIFLACFALCSFLGLLKQFFVYKTCTIPMFWKNSRDREEELASTSVATDFPLNLCLPYWADVSYGAQEPNEDSPYLFSWVTVHDCDTLLLHTISIGKLRGVEEGNSATPSETHAKSENIWFWVWAWMLNDFFFKLTLKECLSLSSVFCAWAALIDLENAHRVLWFVPLTIDKYDDKHFISSFREPSPTF